MTLDRDPGRPERPVLTGLIALGAVALAVGLVLAGVALVATRFLGLGGDDSTSGDSTERESLYLPRPEKTTASGPDVTLNTSAGETDGQQSEKSEPTESKSPEKEITLSAGQTTVPNFGRIDLTGVYPGGEGAVLQVQRFEAGRWAEFDVTIPVSNETFSTYVQTGVSGVNRFRVVDPATGEASNEVKVTVQP